MLICKNLTGNYCKKLLNNGIKKIQIKKTHYDEVLEKYFNWDPPFNTLNISGRVDKHVRNKRRTHIPDAWILEAAVDAEKIGHKMLCLCGDTNLSDELEVHNHSVFKSARDILDILFPAKPADLSCTTFEKVETGIDDQTLLDVLLSKTPNDNIKDSTFAGAKSL